MSDEMKVQTKGLNKKFLFIAIALIAAGLVAALVLLLPTSAKAKKVEEQLNLGAKYLSELDYEQAIVAYEAVIKIDPKCEEAYLALADVYIATGEFEKAEEVLKRAEDSLGELTQAVEAKKQEVLTEKEEAVPIQEPTSSPTSTPIPSPTEVPTLAPTNTPVPTNTPTPSPTEAPTPTPSKAPTYTPTPTAAPAKEGSVRVELKLTSDGFIYGNHEDKYVCTGLSEKGYKEFQKYGPTHLVSITLPSVSDTGNVVEGFWSQRTDGYWLGKMLTEDSAYVELVCPDSFVVYSGVYDEWIDSNYVHKLRNVVLNYGLETVGWGAFKECTGLTEVVIPSSVTKIETNAFYGCSELSKITLPESVTEYGSEVFRGCEKLVMDSIEMAGKLFGSSVFADVTIRNVKLSGPTEADFYGVWKNAKVEKIEIADGVEEISTDAFAGCATVKEVKIPSSVKTIGWGAFKECTGLTEVVIPSSVTKIETNAFYGCSELSKITLPESVVEYGSDVFRECDNLCIITSSGSAADIYAKENGIIVQYK